MFKIRRKKGNVIVAKDISEPVSAGTPNSEGTVLPAHESVVKPEGNTPIYTEVRIDESKDTHAIQEEES